MKFDKDLKRKKEPKYISRNRVNNGKWNKTTFFTFLKNSRLVKSKKVRFKTMSGNSNQAVIDIPETFSLLKEPDAAIETLKKLYSVYNTKNINSIYFDHENCHYMDLDASVIFDVFVLNIERDFRIRTGRDLKLEGRTSRDFNVSRLLYVNGLLKNLNVLTTDEIKKIEETNSILNAELIKGGKNTSSMMVNTSINSAEASEKILSFFNECLTTQGLELNADGFGLFADLMGEVIDNSILHSGDFNQWFTIGHYVKDEEQVYGQCNIVLFNFGQTIYEGLKNTFNNRNYIKDSKLSALKNNLERLTKKHNSFFKPSWDEEVLWTLYALQDGVSRYLSEEFPDRGTGTVTMIDAFQQIGDTKDGKKPEMCIVSGSSYINFDSRYKLSPNKDGGRQTIAFNDENSLNLPPNDNYVKKIKHYFPGTIISMKFYLDREYLIDKVKENQ